ncbi:MAG: peptidase M14 [Phycisphaera sp.]|nr:peptidase M14 [Phycisphaera sp.]
MTWPVGLIEASSDARFVELDEVHRRLGDLCAAHASVARCEVIGHSEQGRELLGVSLGRGARRASLISGSHADEPVGTRTLLHFVESTVREAAADGDGAAATLLDRYTFAIVPHVNPDGAAINAAWVRHWPDPTAYLRDVVRELPGRDIEFGYPDMRPENVAVSAYLRRFAPLTMHVSLHGMAVAEGGMLLIERSWIDRTYELRKRYAEAMVNTGLGLHDHDRGGDKGFEYIEAGFTTTPRGAAMREHFEAISDHDTAAKFHDSSMEYVRSLGGDPLCLVTEIPLWRMSRASGDTKAGVPGAYLAFRQMLPSLQAAAMRGDHETISDAVARFGVEPVALSAAMNLQLRAIGLGLAAASGDGGA